MGNAVLAILRIAIVVRMKAFAAGRFHRPWPAIRIITVSLFARPLRNVWNALHRRGSRLLVGEPQDLIRRQARLAG